MIDGRLEQLAEILVGGSTRTGPGDRVLIAMVEPETFPLARAVYRQALKAGAYPQVQFGSSLLDADLLRHAEDAFVDRSPDLDVTGVRWAEVYIGLRGFRNPHELDGVPPERLAAHRRAVGVVSALRTERTRWVLVRVPGEALAQQAGLPEDELWALFFDAALRDWKAEKKRLRRIADLFEAAGQVQLVGEGTDLTFSTAGRRYLLGDGTHNVPDGEVYTAPIEDSAEGRIAFEFPGLYGGTRIEGVELEFRAGVVVEAKANKGTELLQEVLVIDEGASRIGEFGIGANDGITRFSGDILYDEKIGGTVHLALGRAYAECGGRNHSAIHWDLIKDLRVEGQILLDGETVFEKGRWVGLAL
jgi:aminopeptidase